MTVSQNLLLVSMYPIHSKNITRISSAVCFSISSNKAAITDAHQVPGVYVKRFRNEQEKHSSFEKVKNCSKLA
jgi:hypothetical protein